MDYMPKDRSDEFSATDDGAAIRTDRDLLAMVGMSEAVAASYLGKSRQALNVKLAPQKSGEERDPYFKVSEIVLLVVAARTRGRSFDRDAVWRYVEATKGQRSGTSKESLAMLEEILRGSGHVDLAQAGTVVMILPDFADQRAELPEVSKDLRRLSAELAAMRPLPRVAVLSSTLMQGKMAVEWLGLSEERTRVFRHDDLDHYVPCLLVFPRDGSDPRGYLLTDLGDIVPAPQFRANVIGSSVRYMLPVDAREELFTYRPEEGVEDNGDENEKEVRPRKRA